MPAAGQIWSTYGLAGSGNPGMNREDLLDLVTMIDPWDTPFFSSAPKSTAQLTLHEWLTDALAATATGGRVEGEDFAASTLVARTRLNNLTQIFARHAVVSDTQRAVNPAGVRDEYEYQIMKAMREVARNVEARIWSVSGGAVTGTTAAARVMSAFTDFIQGAATTVNGKDVTITTALINTAMELAYTNGSNPDSLYVSPGTKSDLTAAALPTQFARNLAAADKRLVLNVDIYESDFGLLAVVPDRWMRQSTTSTGSAGAVLCERSKARIAFLLPIRHVPIAKAGDATRAMVVGELTLEILHPSAHVRISGLIT